MQFVQHLKDQPVDIIGDVHGEYHALMSLLDQLGYSEAGQHAQNRKLVFIGDLVDRGPDSPAVMDKVIALCEAGVAQMVLGNHELNILCNLRKGGNQWILDAGSKADETSFKYASLAQRQHYLDFLSRQPFALNGKHLRIVHACWNSSAIDSLQQLQGWNKPIAEIYQQIVDEIQERLVAAPYAALQREEQLQHAKEIQDPQWWPKMLAGHAAINLLEQMKNPFRVVTTSEEKVADQPFWAGGKWRMVERVRWWEQYESDTPVIIGHFWRLFDDQARRLSGAFGPDVFAGIGSHSWMGKHNNVYCVDYSVGQRHLERQQIDRQGYGGKLAALSYPQWTVTHDDGTVIQVGAPGC